VILVFTFWS